jgi:hypothetical protein
MHSYKEERRRQLAVHMDIIHNQSVNPVLFECAGIRRSGGASWPPMWTLSLINQLTSSVRMRRYKEERRRQLAAHVGTLSLINQLTSFVHIRRYMEERRRQLAFHMNIIHIQSVNLCCAHAQV